MNDKPSPTARMVPRKVSPEAQRKLEYVKKLWKNWCKQFYCSIFFINFIVINN